LGKNEKTIISVSNNNTQQTMLTQLQYPSPLERVLQISTIQHLFEANRYLERTVEEFYASKKVIEVQWFNMQDSWRL